MGIHTWFSVSSGNLVRIFEQLPASVSPSGSGASNAASMIPRGRQGIHKHADIVLIKLFIRLI